MIELSDRDLGAIAGSRVWEGKRYKLAMNVMSSILVFVFVVFLGYAILLASGKLPTGIPDIVGWIGMGYLLAYFLFFFITSLVKSKQILKELKRERDK